MYHTRAHFARQSTGLAKGGMLFEKSVCSNSICDLSRAVIMSGKHSHKNGFMNNGKRTRESAST